MAQAMEVFVRKCEIYTRYGVGCFNYDLWVVKAKHKMLFFSDLAGSRNGEWRVRESVT